MGSSEASVLGRIESSRSNSQTVQHPTQYFAKGKIVVGFGDPVLDLLCPNVSGNMIRETLHMEAGGCTAIEEEQLEELLRLPELKSGIVQTAGGSAANVCKVLAGLSNGIFTVQFIGGIGDDAVGREYEEKLLAAGVAPFLIKSASAPTATCICLINPEDGERTMRTRLGAALEFNKVEQLPIEFIEMASCGQMSLFHAEGYSLYRSDVTLGALRAAKRMNVPVSLDLASKEVYMDCRELFESVLKEGLVDILFCNEQEAEAVFNQRRLVVEINSNCSRLDAVQDYFLQYVKVAVISKGRHGCMAKSCEGMGASPADEVIVCDTVGAGDAFTAGFLYSWLLGAPLDLCCRVACSAGAEAVQAVGGELSKEALVRLQKTCELLLTA